MRFALLDQIRCSCGNDEFRVEDAVTAEVGYPSIDYGACRRFCGWKQAPLTATRPDPAECNRCRRRTIIQGTLNCKCGWRWPIVDGAPSFSTKRLREVPSRRFLVTETNPRVDPRWEPFVRAHPRGSPFHHPGWLQALEEEYGQSRFHLACEDSEGRLLAVLPMFYTRGLPFNLGGHVTRRRLSSLPRTPLGGVLSLDTEASTALLQTAVHSSQEGFGAQLQIKTEDADLDTTAAGLVRIVWRPTYQICLPENEAGLTFGNSATRHRIKWAVNKAVKLGLRVRDADTETELRAWYPLYLDVMRRNAVPPRPYRFFRDLWTILRPAGVLRLMLAERQDAGRTKLLAGSIILSFGGMASYAFTGGRKRDFALHPNDLIQWQAIHDACRTGARRYDFGEVAEEHQALMNFKTKWGAEAKNLYRYYGPSPHAAMAGEHGSTGWLRRVTAFGWRRLPLAATERLGDRLYSYL